MFEYINEALRWLPALLAIRLLMILLRRDYRKRISIIHEAGVIIWMLYLAVVFHITINYIALLKGYFRIAKEYNLTPFAGISSIMSSGYSSYALMNIAGNIAMFVPMGLMPPLLWRRWSFSRATLFSCSVSILIEVTQLFTGRGTDIDDVILNTLGGAIGYALYALLGSVWPRLSICFRKA